MTVRAAHILITFLRLLTSSAFSSGNKHLLHAKLPVSVDAKRLFCFFTSDKGLQL